MQVLNLFAFIVLTMINVTYGFQRVTSLGLVRANSGMASIRGQMRMMARKKKEMPPNPVAGSYSILLSQQIYRLFLHFN